MWVCGDDIDTDTTDPNTDTLLTLVCTAGQVAKWDGANWTCGEDIDTDTTDPNTDVLAGLACAEGQLPKWDAVSSLWVCGDDIDTDTTDPNTDTLQDLALTCFDGEIPSWDQSGGLWICIANIDTNTQLTEAQVDSYVANNNYSVGAHTIDTDTQLTNAEVGTAALAEGFVTGPHTTDTNTQLSESTVETYVTNGAIDLASGSTIGGSAPLTLSYLGTRIYKQTLITPSPWPNVVGTVSCNSGDKVLGGGCGGGCAQVMISAPSGEGWYCRCTSTWTGSITATAICLDL
jgi:hypothetical protein